MKKLVFIALAATVFASCSSTNQAEQEKKDSIAAAAKADSMLQAELAADSSKVDSAKVDTVKKK